MIFLRIQIECHIYRNTLIVQVLPKKLLTHGRKI
jgi:hypothetical protein